MQPERSDAPHKGGKGHREMLSRRAHASSHSRCQRADASSEHSRAGLQPGAPEPWSRTWHHVPATLLWTNFGGMGSRTGEVHLRSHGVRGTGRRGVARLVAAPVLSSVATRYGGRPYSLHFDLHVPESRVDAPSSSGGVSGDSVRSSVMLARALACSALPSSPASACPMPKAVLDGVRTRATFVIGA